MKENHRVSYEFASTVWGFALAQSEPFLKRLPLPRTNTQASSIWLMAASKRSSMSQIRFQKKYHHFISSEDPAYIYVQMIILANKKPIYMSFFPWRLAASSGFRSPYALFKKKSQHFLASIIFGFFRSSPDRLPKTSLKRLRCLRWVCFSFRLQAIFKRKCWLFIFLLGFLPQVFLCQKNPTSRMGFCFFLVCG